MDRNLIYAKTPIGDEAVRQSTRVVQRNLRMVLVQVDGKLTVGELGQKIGDSRLVESALSQLEGGGYIAPTAEAVSVWQESRLRVERLKASAASGLSSFVTRTGAVGDVRRGSGAASSFSTVDPPRLSPGRGNGDADDSAAERDGAFRRRSPLLLLMSGLLVVLLIAIAVVMFFPYNRIKPEIEKELGQLLRTTVQVGDVSLKLLPRPGLLLSDLRIGARGESAIERIRIDSLTSLLVSGGRTVQRVEVIGGKITADHLAALPQLDVGQERAGSQLAIREAGFERLSIIAGPLVFGELNGDVKFLTNGRIEKAALRTVDRSLRVEMQPSGQGALLTFEGLGWRPTDDSVLTFDSLQAQALLQSSRLMVQHFDARVLGGVLRGNGLLDWSRGLAMTGEATLERLDCRKVAAVFAPSLALEGDLMGPLRLRGVGSDWRTMWANAQTTLDAVVMRGVLHGVDLGEAARRGQGSLVRAGSTRFDRLGVQVSIDPRQVIGRDLGMSAGMFTATGQFVASRDRQVDAKLLVTMQTSVSSLTLPIRVSGTLPTLQAASLR